MIISTRANFLVSISLIFLLAACDQSEPQIIKHLELTENWQLQSSVQVKEKGEEISSISYQPKEWYKAQVPGTVLGSLVADSIYKNIFYGRNLAKIPDSLFNVPWWYRTVFSLNHKDSNQVFRLLFNGINYRADIWLNGHKVASSDSVEGSFRRFTFDVGNYIKKGKNIL